MDNRHFVDGKMAGPKFRETIAKIYGRARHLADEEYGNIVLPNVVVACVDAALQYDGKLLLGKRMNEPYQGGWAYSGGRMTPGESYGMAASRHVMRDCGLNINPQRFSFVRSDSWVWSRRAQEPKDWGCHMNGVAVTALITPKEAARISCRGDFREMRWWHPSDILMNRRIHPAVREVAGDILSGRVS